MMWRFAVWGVSGIAGLDSLFREAPLLSRIPSAAKWLLAIAIFSLCSYLLFPFANSAWRAEQASKMDGVIEAPYGEPDRVLVKMGESASILRFTAPNPKITPFIRAGDTPLYVWRDSGRYHVTATIRGEDGNVAVKVNDNRWEVSRSDWDKNYSDTALEVRDRGASKTNSCIV